MVMGGMPEIEQELHIHANLRKTAEVAVSTPDFENAEVLGIFISSTVADHAVFYKANYFFLFLDFGNGAVLAHQR